MEERTKVFVMVNGIDWAELEPGDWITSDEPRTEDMWDEAPVFRIAGIAAGAADGTFEEAGVEFASVVMTTDSSGCIPLVGIACSEGFSLPGVIKVDADRAHRCLAKAAKEQLRRRKDAAISKRMARNRQAIDAAFASALQEAGVADLNSFAEGGDE